MPTHINNNFKKKFIYYTRAVWILGYVFNIMYLILFYNDNKGIFYITF